MPPKARTSV